MLTVEDLSIQTNWLQFSNIAGSEDDVVYPYEKGTANHMETVLNDHTKV